jgi:hypothetical protein
MLPDPAIRASTILVVDDEEFLLEYVRIVLLRSGFAVLAAQTGEEAWQLILDSRNEIRLMTGAPLENYYSSSADSLVSKRPLLRKPFDPEQLLAIVRENLEAASISPRGF